jgi:hypothetical protein
MLHKLAHTHKGIMASRQLLNDGGQSRNRLRAVSATIVQQNDCAISSQVENARHNDGCSG